MARKPKEAAPADGAPMLALIDQDAPKDSALVVVADTPPEEQAKRAASIVLLNPERFDQFYERMKAETSAFVPDLLTDKGRRELASLAFRVTKTKTTLEKAALELTADWRARTKAVNDARAPIVNRLDALAAEVRKPLTDWEAAEDARVTANEATLAELRAATIIAEDDTSATVADRGRRIYGMKFEAPQWTAEEVVDAITTRQATVDSLLKSVAVLKQKEADAAELERLRAAEAERLERERVEREAREAAEREAAEAREREEAAERARQEAEQRERDAEERRERERREAAEAATREAEERAAAAQRERDAEHARQLAAEREERERVEREAREAEEARQREADRIAAEQRERDRVTAEEAEAERKRQANRTHRGNVQRQVKEALMTCGVDEDTAKKIVLAIVAGNVPHTAVTF